MCPSSWCSDSELPALTSGLHTHTALHHHRGTSLEGPVRYKSGYRGVNIVPQSESTHCIQMNREFGAHERRQPSYLLAAAWRTVRGALVLASILTGE